MSFWKSFFRKSKPPNFSGPDQNSPEAFIRSYCIDYTSWNSYCNQLADEAETAKKEFPWDECSQSYKELLSEYVADGVKSQLPTFGSHSTFDPSRLSIGNTDHEGNLIKQIFFIELPNTTGQDEFFAELELNPSGGFKLQQIYYIDPFPEDYAKEGSAALPFL